MKKKLIRGLQLGIITPLMAVVLNLPYWMSAKALSPEVSAGQVDSDQIITEYFSSDVKALPELEFSRESELELRIGSPPAESTEASIEANIKLFVKPFEEHLNPLQVTKRDLPERARRRYDVMLGKLGDYFEGVMDRIPQFEKLISEICEKYNIPIDLFYAVGLTESELNPRVNKNGMMQITDIAAKDLTENPNRYGFKGALNCIKRRDLSKHLECAAIKLAANYRVFDTDEKFNNLSREDKWMLAAVAYAEGINGIKSSLIKSGTNNYWELKRHQTTEQGWNYGAKIAAWLAVFNEHDQILARMQYR